MEEKQRHLNDGLKKIELKLETALQPLKIRSAFVSDLRQRLEAEMAQRRKKAKMKKALLVAGSVVGGGLMVVAIIRSLTSWREIAHTIDGWLPKQGEEHQAISA
ncbi:MAG: hypothetical protein B6I38_00200 [Anaerolineaceae bacterium 4572_5.1]|nr:MAG: hypothetical protein B6I38_00200 [Anaerolineaceae bacterium 4572_5.1]RLD07049.1 MAG: hypothetical protein DRI56_07195 [Chloroflexota bacterium]